MVVRQIDGELPHHIVIDGYRSVLFPDLHLVQCLHRDRHIPVEEVERDLLGQILLAVFLIRQQFRIIRGDIRQFVVIRRIEDQFGVPSFGGCHRRIDKPVGIDVVPLILGDDREPLLRHIHIRILRGMLRLTVQEIEGLQVFPRLFRNPLHLHIDMLADTLVARDEIRKRKAQDIAVQQLIDLLFNVVFDPEPRDLPDHSALLRDIDHRIIARVRQRGDRLLGGHAGTVDAVDHCRVRKRLGILFIVNREHDKTHCHQQRAEYDCEDHRSFSHPSCSSFLPSKSISLYYMIWWYSSRSHRRFLQYI